MFTSLNDDDEDNNGGRSRSPRNAKPRVHAPPSSGSSIVSPMLEQVKEQSSKVKNLLTVPGSSSNKEKSKLWESKGNLVFGPTNSKSGHSANSVSSGSTNTSRGSRLNQLLPGRLQSSSSKSASKSAAGSVRSGASIKSGGASLKSGGASLKSARSSSDPEDEYYFSQQKQQPQETPPQSPTRRTSSPKATVRKQPSAPTSPKARASPRRATMSMMSPTSTADSKPSIEKVRKVIIRKADGTTMTKILKPGETLPERFKKSPVRTVRRKSLGATAVPAPTVETAKQSPPRTATRRRASMGRPAAALSTSPKGNTPQQTQQSSPDPLTPRQRYRRATMTHVTNGGLPHTPNMAPKVSVAVASAQGQQPVDVFDTTAWPETPGLHIPQQQKKKRHNMGVPSLDDDDDVGEPVLSSTTAVIKTRLYEYARQCQWKSVAEECSLFPRDAKCVDPVDGTTALHLAVMSRANPVLRDGTADLEPAPLELIEQLAAACPEAAITRDNVKKYTPLTYACLVLDGYYPMEDGRTMVRILLQHAPQSAYVFTDDGFSALDVHILSFSRFHRQDTAPDSSTLVLQTLLEARPDLAEARSYKNRVRGPLELLYRSNLDLFKDVGNATTAQQSIRNSAHSNVTTPIPSPKTPHDWWAWKWVDLLLQHAPHTQDTTKQSSSDGESSFQSLHAAVRVVGCPMPILMIAAQSNPSQLKTVVNEFGNLPLHEVCAWICDREMIAGDPFVLRRKLAAIEALLQLYPEAAKVRNNMGETPLQLAIESKTPFHGGLDLLVESYPSALAIPRKLRAVDDDNELLLSVDVYDDNESVDSDWVDPVLAVEGMYPFLVAAVVSFIPEARRRPGFFSDKNPEEYAADLAKRELENLRSIYGLLRAKPSVFGLYQPVFRVKKSGNNEPEEFSEFTEVVEDEEDDVDSDYTEVTYDE